MWWIGVWIWVGLIEVNKWFNWFSNGFYWNQIKLDLKILWALDNLNGIGYEKWILNLDSD